MKQLKKERLLHGEKFKKLLNALKKAAESKGHNIVNDLVTSHKNLDLDCNMSLKVCCKGKSWRNER